MAYSLIVVVGFVAVLIGLFRRGVVYGAILSGDISWLFSRCQCSDRKAWGWVVLSALWWATFVLFLIAPIPLLAQFALSYTGSAVALPVSADEIRLLVMSTFVWLTVSILSHTQSANILTDASHTIASKD